MANYNSQAFTPEEVKKGLLKDLLDYLLEHNRKAEEQYYDIHITTDGYCSIVEWTGVSYKFEGEEGKFEFVPSDGYVVLERSFPDNHTELCYSEEDYQERLDEFLKENPGWVKTHYGAWTNEIENEKYRKQLEESCNKSIPAESLKDDNI